MAWSELRKKRGLKLVQEQANKQEHFLMKKLIIFLVIRFLCTGKRRDLNKNKQEKKKSQKRRCQFKIQTKLWGSYLCVFL